MTTTAMLYPVDSTGFLKLFVKLRRFLYIKNQDLIIKFDLYGISIEQRKDVETWASCQNPCFA
jgi:hypothetical protein